MHIIHVSILHTTQSPRESLSYFFKRDLPVGQVVTVPMGKKHLPAVVIGTESAAANRALLRQAGFQLRSVTEVLDYQFPIAIMNMARDMADRFAIALGSLLELSLPEPWRPTEVPTESAGDITYWQGESADRLEFIQNRVLEKMPTIICSPTINGVNDLADYLGTDQQLVFHSKISKNKLIKQLAAWREGNITTAFTTPHFLLALATRSDLTIIIDRENSPSYYRNQTPYFDYRTLAIQIAQHLGNTVTFTDTLISLATYRGHTQHPSSTEKFFAQPVVFTPVEKKKRSQNINEENLLLPETQNLIKDIESSDQTTLVFVNRHGLATSIVCQDCHKAAVDPDGDKYRLYEDEDGNRWYINAKNKKIPARHTCQFCHSVRMKTLGTTLDRIASEIQSLVKNPDIVTTVTAETHKTKKSQQALETAINNGPAIVIATSKIFSLWNDRKLDHIIIPSLYHLGPWGHYDSDLVSLYNLERLRDLGTNLVVQSPKDHYHLISYFGKSQAKLYQREINMRQKFGLPPEGFYTLILSADKKRSKVNPFASLLQQATFHSDGVKIDNLENSRRWQYEVVIPNALNNDIGFLLETMPIWVTIQVK
jgi:primosomal protein N'